MLRALTVHTPYGIFRSDRDGKCVYVNERWCELAGLAVEQALGDGWMAALHPDDRERVLGEWSVAAEEGRDSIVEYRFRRGDGSICWIEGFATALRDEHGGVSGWVGTCLDLTARKVAEEELLRASERFRASFENAPIGVAMVSLDGRWLTANRTVSELLGYSQDDLLRLAPSDFIHPDDLAADLDQVRRVAAGEARTYETEKRYLRPDGRPVWVALSVSLVRDRDGEPLYLVSHIQDIDERKRADQELERLANHDSLTGLRNRRRLTADLEAALAPGDDPSSYLLAIFDLNGFKSYNDSFGHPAGDALLARLARRLADAAAPHGHAYRLGGDEFCLLIDAPPAAAGATLTAAVAALSDRGEGFDVSSSFGAVFLPGEAHDPDTALTLADQRLYAQKQRFPTSRQDPSEVLRRMLSELEPGLRQHIDAVADLSARVGARLGLTGDSLDELRLAAELHDIGKLAIPDAVLQKPGPLSDEEWALVRGHTLVAQRILAGAPALQSVGEIVRATHERWDGTGYVDALASREIPLPARIIAVCDAYTAMISDRPYRKALSHGEALTELRRCAFTQFDPEVVRVFCSEVDSCVSLGGAGSSGRISAG